MRKSKTYMPSLLNYQYSNQKVPTAMPLNAQEGRIIRVQAQLSPILVRPALGSFSTTPPRSIATTRRSLGGVANLTLNERSISARVLLQASGTTSLQDAVAANASTVDTASTSETTTTTFKYPRIVLDKLGVTSAGKKGGYFYNVYLNLPASGSADVESQSHFLGTFGPFEVSGAIHHGEGSLVLPATDVLRNVGVANLKEVVISLVRVNGPNYPTGPVLTVGEMRLELSTEGP
jgi:tyrosinase